VLLMKIKRGLVGQSSRRVLTLLKPMNQTSVVVEQPAHIADNGPDPKRGQLLLPTARQGMDSVSFRQPPRRHAPAQVAAADDELVHDTFVPPRIVPPLTYDIG